MYQICQLEDTVKGFIVEAKKMIHEDRAGESEKLLVQAANSLSAFSEVQAYFDPFELWNDKQKTTERKCINDYFLVIIMSDGHDRT
jgi:hypothetical protein